MGDRDRGDSKAVDTTMRAVVTDGRGGLRPTKVARPVPASDGALVRVLACGFCGSDLEKLAPLRAAPAAAEPGRVLGHEVVGVLEQPGQPPRRVALAHHVPCGRCDLCLTGHSSLCAQFVATDLDPGGFAEYLAVSAAHLDDAVFDLPDHVDDLTGTLLEPLSCVLRGLDVAAAALRDSFPAPGVRGAAGSGVAAAAGPSAAAFGGAAPGSGAYPAPKAAPGAPTDGVPTATGTSAVRIAPLAAPTVLVAGCGSVGLLFLSVVAAAEVDAPLWAGARALFLERDPERAAMAAGLGARAAGEGDLADVAVVTAPATLGEVVARMAPGGVVVVFAAGDRVAGADFDLDTFYRSELTLVGVRSGSPGHLRWALALLAGGRLPLDWFHPEVATMEGLADAALRYARGETLKVVMRP
ncbi:MAG: alcohol dehydrogenase catalytic domain-containing protein [Actinobacteria bacterium]|nr:alcohol dehydrogenase catalytic domain-containing protein [Actinomycetota bacterium]